MDPFKLKWWEEIWFPIRRFLLDIPYWIRSHTYRRYHLLDIRSKHDINGYRWGWIDKDSAMLLALMRLMCDFVEKELTPKYKNGRVTLHHYLMDPDEYGDYDDQSRLYMELESIYNWWTVDRPAKAREQAEWSKKIDIKWTESGNLYEGQKGFTMELVELEPGAQDKIRELDRRMANLEEEMVFRLMKIRKGLWT